MVDLGGLKDKATGAIADNADAIKDGVTQAADAVADKVGHKDKIDKAKDAVTGVVDKLAGDQ